MGSDNPHFVGERSGTRAIVAVQRSTESPRTYLIVQCDCGVESKICATNFRKTTNCTKCHARRGKPPGAGTKYTGNPCRRGHSGVRFVSSKACVECVRLANQSKSKGLRRRSTGGKRQRDPEERLRAQRKYLAKDGNRAKHQSYIRNRRAKQRAAPGLHTGEEINDLFRKQKGKCAYCRRPLGDEFEVDHIMPIALGGSNWISNIQLTCKSCNRKKNAKHPIEFAKEINLLL